MSNGTDSAHVDHLISGLGAGGAVDSVGDFTLDRDKARDKMRQFQLAEPHRYVLELVQAAVLKGATRIDFDIDADDMRMSFDGQPFDREDFDALYSSLFARMRNPRNDARQHLAVGLNAAMALNPRWVRVDSGTGDQATRLELRPKKEDRFAERDEGETTVIHVKARFRPGLLVKFYQNTQRTIPEEKLLRTHCARARTQIYLDGKSINRGYDLPGAIAEQPLEGEGVHGLVGFNPSHGQGAIIEWIKHGVWITTHDFQPGRDHAWEEALGLSVYYGFTAVVEADALRMDFSRQDIVWDDAYRDVLAQLEAARNESVKQICEWVVKEHSLAVNHPSEWARLTLKRVTSTLSTAALGSEDPSALGYHVARAPIWTTVTGERVSLAALWQEVNENGTVGYTFGDFGDDRDPDLSPTRLCAGRVVFQPENAPEEALMKRILGRQLRLVTYALQARLLAAQSLARFRKRQMAVALPDGISYLAMKTVMTREVRGVLGLRHDQEPSRMSVVRDGCLLVQLTCDRSLPGLELVFEGDFTPNDTFTNIVPDVVYGLAVSTALSSLEALYVSGLDSLSTLTNARQRQVQTFLMATLTPGFADRFLRAWGADKFVADPPTLELSLGVGNQPLPLGSDTPHALARVPLIRDVTHRRWSLVELSAQLERLGHLPWVSCSMPPNPDYDRLLLRLDVTEKALLDGVFGARLRYDATEYEASLRLAAHRAKPQVPLDGVTTGPAVFRVGFVSGSLRGMLVFRMAGEVATVAPSSVTLLFEQRKLLTYDVELGVPDLAAYLNDDGFQPNAQWSGLQSPEDETRCQGIVHTAAVRVLGHLAEHWALVQEQFRSAVRRLLRKSLTALVPQAVFGEALRRLVDRDRTPWTRYMQVAALLARVDRDRLVTGLRRLLNAGQPLTAEALWSQVTPDGTSPRPGPRVQVDLADCAELFREPPPNRKTDVPLIRRLEGLELFCTAGGARMDLATLRIRAKEAPVPYLSDDADAGIVADQLVLIAPRADCNDLIRLLGPEALCDGRPLVEARRTVHEFESRTESDLRLLPDTTLVKLGRHEGEITGEVGLAAEPEGGNWVLVHKRHRYVCREEGVFSQGLVAVLNSDELTTTEDYRAVEPDGARARLLALAEDTLPGLLNWLLGRWSQLEATQMDPAYDHMLAYLAGPVAMAQARGEQPVSDLVRGLGALQHLPGVGGRRYSLDDLRAEYADQGELVYLPAAAEGNTRRKIPILTTSRLAWITRIFHRVRDFSEEWQQTHLQESFGLVDAPDLVSHHPDEELLGESCRVAGFTGRMYLPLSPEEPLLLRFGVAGLQLRTEVLVDHAPCAGHLEIPHSTYRQKGGQVQLAPHDRYNLQSVCIRLYRDLLNRFSEYQNPLQRTRAEGLLTDAVLALHARVYGQSATLEHRWVRLYNDLSHLPLLRLSDGAAISVAAARERRPAELSHLELWQPEPLAAPPSPIGGPPPAPSPPPPLEAPPPGAAPPSEAISPGGPPSPPSPPSDEMAPVVEPERPEERLAKQLRRAFEQLLPAPDESQADMGSQEIGRQLSRNLRFSDRESPEAADCDKTGLVLFRGHPLVQGILVSGTEDPLLLSFLLSAVYTAVNLYLERVTDDHEDAFLLTLTGGMLADLQVDAPEPDLRSAPTPATK